MQEDSTAGMYYTPDKIPPEGVYADIQDGKAPPLCGVVALVLLAMLGGVLWMLTEAL